MGERLRVVLIGAGNRGETYSRIMASMPQQYEMVAVAEKIDSRRNTIKELFQLSEERCFQDGEALFALGKIADAAIIATMDREHYPMVMRAIALGYDILLEKPVSTNARECMEVAAFARENGVRVVVCHVLRYSPFFRTIKDIILQGRLGAIISINHQECVGNVHQSHSFVRGNWGREERSACMLLAKSCHDLDILQWLLQKECRKIQSFGALTYFRPENAPEHAPEYCIDGCPGADECPYNAVALYLDDKDNDWFRTTCARQANPTDEMIEHALRTTPYGKCVFRCDNDVVDHQTVNLLFEDDVTVNFSMCAFNKGGRYIHICGTKGELTAAMDGENEPIRLYEFETKQTSFLPVNATDGVTGGHGGGDKGIIQSFYEYLTGTYTGVSISDIQTSVNNHLMVFAAEESRRTGKVVDFERFKRKYHSSIDVYSRQ